MDLQKLAQDYPELSITIKAVDLNQAIETAAHKAAAAALQSHIDKKKTAQEVMEEFKVCRTTIWQWEKAGWLKGVTIGGRKYYLQSELDKLTSKKGQ